MSGYGELRDLGVTFRPYDGPPPATGGTWSRFDSPWHATVDTLARELRALDAHNIVVELDITDADLRIDGIPRANARLARDGVRISFDSKWGPLRYETGEFIGWQENVRAIALSMEALRKVDRYGVSKRGEQYRGWRQLPTGTDPADAIQTRDQAQALIDSHGGLVAAIKATHPDHGGDATEFRKVMRAKELLG